MRLAAKTRLQVATGTHSQERVAHIGQKRVAHIGQDAANSCKGLMHHAAKTRQQSVTDAQRQESKA